MSAKSGEASKKKEESCKIGWKIDFLFALDILQKNVPLGTLFNILCYEIINYDSFQTIEDEN